VVEIARLGAQGDGVIETPAGPRYVPFALPGERWRLAEAEPDALIGRHPARAEPVCPHFGSCGGCVAQHMPEDLYAAWKQAMLVEAFRHRGIAAPLEPLYRLPAGSRRRLTLHARREGGVLRVGFQRRAAHDLVDITRCPVAVPQIVAALPAVREMLEPVVTGRTQAAVHVLATKAGLDVHLAFTRAAAALTREYPRLATVASRIGLARLSVGGDTLLQARRPTLTFDGVAVEPPPGAFVQAVAQAESEMIRLVTAATASAKSVADLFCGIGTFTLPMARSARVLAVDAREDAVAALAAAARQAQGRKPIEAKVRDLFRTPLGARELDGFDAVVLDPPAAGARAQAGQIARSRVPLVVYVSCDAGTRARWRATPEPWSMPAIAWSVFHPSTSSSSRTTWRRSRCSGASLAVPQPIVVSTS
jgi:23S rRNA (uracil1939-C5)-methyltransferase